MSIEKNEKANNGLIKTDEAGHTYLNSYFGLEVALPRAWCLLEHSDLLQGLKIQLDKMGIQGAQKEQFIASATTTSINLLRASAFPSGDRQPYNASGVKDNPSLTLYAQHVSNNPNHSSESFLNAMKDQMAKGMTGFTVSVEKDLYKADFGGKDFSSIDLCASLSDGSFKSYTKLFSATIKDYELAFTISYVTQEGGEDLLNILKAIKVN